MTHYFVQEDDNKQQHKDRAGIQKDMRPQEFATQGFAPRQICGTYPMSKTMDKLSVSKSKQKGQ